MLFKFLWLKWFFSSFWNQSKIFNFFFSFSISISIYIFVKFCVIAWSSSTAKSPLAICGHYYICIRSFSVCLFVCLIVWMPICLSVLMYCISLGSSICLSVHLCIRSFSVCLLVCVSICLFVCTFFGLSVCLSVHL